VPTGPRPHVRRAPFRIPFWLGFCLFLAIALFFLLTEHRAHLFGTLPFVLLLLCPLLHRFMHRGHGGHGGDHSGHDGQPPDFRGEGAAP
jgi:hypothetical protein